MQNTFKNVGWRFRRSMRAISPVIAVLLMIVIAVAAALVAYAWVMGYLSFTTAKVGKAVQIQSVARSEANNVTIWVQNVGDSEVVVSDVYVNDVLNVPVTSLPITLPSTETAMIELSGTHSGLQVKVKVVTNDGAFIEYTKTFTSTSGGGEGPTPPPTYQYRKQITLTGVVGGPHPNFPVLISISGDTDIGGGSGGSGGSVDGDHIYFTDTDGTTKLDHEVERFSVVGGAASMVAWVRVPSLMDDKVIYLYYGSDIAGGQENPTGVWDSSYRAVYHLSEDPSGTAPQLGDSTGNNNGATSHGSMTTSDQVSAKTDGGLDFDGSNDYLEAPHTSSLDITGNTITLSAWVNPQSQGSAAQIILSKPYSSTTHSNPYFAYSIHLLNGGNRPRMYITTNGSPKMIQSSATIPYGSWSYVTGVYTGSNLIIYVNGVQQGSTSASGNINSYTTPLRTGTNGGLSEPYESMMDEVRISSSAHTQDWITTEYSNQNTPAGFMTIGAEEQVPV